ncbi:MAG TPA: ATP-binding cassette domain-containing protein, partial [Acidimicrobiales bacterium]|nr:ATP-binding cassette domain-containing protein [Acidimicrobiales bacterium]
QRVKSAAKVLGITDWLGQKPSQLSGGQRQRVAMGRAIVREPQAFLMDEPLSNLDAKLRVQMRAEVARVQRRIGVATLYVTHDQTEAMTLGHRVAVLRSGVLQQCDAPQVLYDRPANIFVAGFIGSPAMNLLQGALLEDGRTAKVGAQEFTLSEDALRAKPGLKRYVGRPLVIGIRPEDLSIGTSDAATASISGKVELVEALGSELLIHFQSDALMVRAEGGPAVSTVESDGFAGDDEDVSFVARIEPRHTVLVGDTVRFAFSTERLEFFDIETGVAISD